MANSLVTDAPPPTSDMPAGISLLRGGWWWWLCGWQWEGIGGGWRGLGVKARDGVPQPTVTTIANPPHQSPRSSFSDNQRSATVRCNNLADLPVGLHPSVLDKERPRTIGFDGTMDVHIRDKEEGEPHPYHSPSIGRLRSSLSILMHVIRTKKNDLETCCIFLLATHSCWDKPLSELGLLAR